jgi:hypothetical protein
LYLKKQTIEVLKTVKDPKFQTLNMRAVVQKNFIFIFEFFDSVYLNYDDVIKFVMM